MRAADPIREIAEGCIAVRVRLLNRLVSGVCDAGLRGHGVSVAQVNILVAVGQAGPLTPTRLAARLVMDRSTLSRDVNVFSLCCPIHKGKSAGGERMKWRPALP